MTDLDYVELDRQLGLHDSLKEVAYRSSCRCSDGKCKQLGRICRTIHFKRSKCRSMSFYRL